MSDIGIVLGWKFNHQAGMNTEDGVITDFPDGIPSQADQDLWTAEYDAHIIATQYQRNRALEYPSLPEQLDEIYHNGVDSWKAVIKVTKDKYPKG